MTMRDPANWSEPPTADQVALAIVAGSREVGADPIAVASGKVARGPRDVPLTRGRAYAAKALAKVFTSYPRTRIARFVGARGLVAQSYFSALDQRLRSGIASWWDDDVLARVVGAIVCGVVSTPRVEIAAKIEPPLLSDKAARKVGVDVAKLPVAKASHDDEDDGAPVFDRTALAGVKRQQERPRAMSKAEMQADLEDALRRTALMQKPEV